MTWWIGISESIVRHQTCPLYCMLFVLLQGLGETALYGLQSVCGDCAPRGGSVLLWSGGIDSPLKRSPPPPHGAWRWTPSCQLGCTNCIYQVLCVWVFLNAVVHSLSCFLNETKGFHGAQLEATVTGRIGGAQMSSVDVSNWWFWRIEWRQ